MLGKNLLKSTQTLVTLLSVIGSISVLVSLTLPSPAFSTVSTSVDQGQLSQQSSPINGSGGSSSLFQDIEEFLAPSGYVQAREDPSYAINIPFSDLGYSPFEPSSISIPANMTVIWFNDDDSTHTVTFNNNDTNSSESIDSSGDIASGGFFIHQFSVPGNYEYYDSYDPSLKGRIKVGSEFENGQNMDMLIGGDALPFEAGKVERTTFSFVPSDNTTTIPPSLSIIYNVTISDSTGRFLYSNQFGDSDGILDLEIIPSNRSLSSLPNQTNSSSPSSSSNQTASSPQFVTWGPDLTDQEGVASDGVYHIQGPVMTENEDYTIAISIISVDNAEEQQPLSDDFLLPSVNISNNSLVPVD